MDPGLLFKHYVDEILYAAMRWYFLVACVILALISYLYHERNRSGSVGQFVRWLFPNAIYKHRSTRTDLLYLLSFPIIAGLIFKPALGFSTAALSYRFVGAVIARLPVAPLSQPLSGWTTIMLTAGFTLASAMAADFMFYLHHFVLHKSKFLWEFHKVHHSAEVLSPLTDYRAHPLEILTYGVATGFGVGAVQAVFNHVAGDAISTFTVLGLNVIIFVYYVMGYPLRHSHVWISYGPTLSRFFISPAQHQIHHSSAEKHWDKNMGGFFALWDWMFGTLYVPKEREDLVYGLPGDEGKEYSNVAQLYIQPFRNNARSRVGIIVVVALLGFFLYFAASRVGHALSRWIG